MTRKTTTPEFIDKARAVHGSRFDYGRTNYQNNKTPVTITCPMHGDFEQTPSDHLSDRGCRKCGSTSSAVVRSKGADQFLAEARAVHGERYSYLGDYTTFSRKLTITCASHGAFRQAPAHHLAGQGCPACALEDQAQGQTLSQDDFLRRARAVHGERYDYSASVYVGAGLPLTILCREHGAFTQAPSPHWAGSGCRLCYNARHAARITKTQAEFIASATAAHGNYDYSAVTYAGSKQKVQITCESGHTFMQRPNDHLTGHGCSVCLGAGPSVPEQEIAAYLAQLGCEVKTSCRTTLGNGKEIDLLVGNLAIEYDGLFWHNEDHVTPTYHKEKTEQAASVGLQMVHIFEDEWLEKSHIVKARLQAKLGLGEKCHARKLSLVNVTWRTAKTFYEDTHLQGAGAAGTSYGLEQKGQLLACITLGRRAGATEVLRYASTGSVVGGFGRLFQHYIKQHPDVLRIVSYSDLRWGTGQLYATQGFSRQDDTVPGYFWVKKLQRFSRQRFQKHKLPALLERFDVTLSESVNMRNHGYSKIFDCGHAKWLWTRQGL